MRHQKNFNILFLSSLILTLFLLLTSNTVFATTRSEAESAVRSAYRNCLGRNPDSSGLKHHVDLILGGKRASDVRRDICNSPEAISYRNSQSGSTELGSGGVAETITGLSDQGCGRYSKGGFLWKPISETNGKLIVLLDKKYTGHIDRSSVRIISNGAVIERGRYHTIANGDREHYRFGKPGPDYPTNVYLAANLKSGGTVRWLIPNAYSVNSGVGCRGVRTPIDYTPYTEHFQSLLQQQRSSAEEINAMLDEITRSSQVSDHRKLVESFYLQCVQGESAETEIEYYVERLQSGENSILIKNEICGSNDPAGNLVVECQVKETNLAVGEFLDISVKINGGASPYNISWAGETGLIPGFNTRSQSQRVRINKAGSYFLGVLVTDNNGNWTHELCPHITVGASRSVSGDEKRYTQADLDKLIEIMELLKSLGIVGNINNSAITIDTINNAQTGVSSDQTVGPTPANISGAFSRDLTVGSTGPDVYQLQKHLNNSGYVVSETGPGSPGNETNYFGPATQRALIRFQIANNISPASGYFGPITRNRIRSVIILN